MTRARSQGREAALQALYQLDLAETLDDASIDVPLHEGEDDDAQTGEQARRFGESLVLGVRDAREDIDSQLEAIATNWKIGRMAVIEPDILRLGAYELLHRKDVPAAVAINEAILLAQKYSTKESGSFVNGILDTLRTRHGIEA